MFNIPGVNCFVVKIFVYSVQDASELIIIVNYLPDRVQHVCTLGIHVTASFLIDTEGTDHGTVIVNIST